MKMAFSKPLSRMVSQVVLDLDGTFEYRFFLDFIFLGSPCICFYNFRKVSSFFLFMHLFYAYSDGIVNDVLKRFLLKYNKQWNTKVAHNLVGKTSREAATIFLQDYGLPLSVKELMDMITRLFSDQ